MKRPRLFPALLKHWRQRRGLSQLALGLEADVSPRHLSFLESGRARPSEEMVLRLASVLGVPLREQNALLDAAGLEVRFTEGAGLPPEIDAALTQMMEQHEPYPLLVLSLDGTVLKSNRGATALFGRLLADPAAMPPTPDVYTLHFDPRLLRPAVVGWEGLARGMMARLQREALTRDDARLHRRLEALARMPGVAPAWRRPDFDDDRATVQVEYAKGRLRARFLVTATVFLGPRQLELDELRVESCFPLDEATRRACAR